MNRTLLFVGGLFTGLVVGLAVAWSLNNDDPVIDTTGSASSGTDTWEEDSGEMEPRRSVRAPVDKVGGMDLDTWIASVATGGFRPGTGVITGRVTTESGEPVPGVVIHAQRRASSGSRTAPWREGDGIPPEKDMRERLRSFVASTKQEIATRMEAETDREGRYRLENLDDGRYRVSAFGEGMKLRTEDRTSRVAGSGETVDFTVTYLVDLEIAVYLPDGQSPKTSKIAFAEDGSTIRKTWAPGDPGIRMPPGMYEVTATAGENDEFRSDVEIVTLKAGEPASPVAFQLLPLNGIRGHVRFTGEPLGSVHVYALRFEGDVPGHEALIESEEKSWAWPQNDFSYSIHDLDPGRYLLGVGKNNTVYTTSVVDVTDGMIVCDLEIVDDLTEGFLLVWVLGPDGSPIKATGFSSGYNYKGGGSSRGNEPGRRRKDGSYLVSHHSGDEKGAVHSVTVKTGQYGKMKIEYVRAETKELTFKFKEPGSLVVSINGYVGSGVEKLLSLQVALDGEKDGISHYTSSGGRGIDSSGRQKFLRLQPGKYRVELSIRGADRWSNTVLESTSVFVNAGEASISVNLPPLYSLTVEVGDPELVGDEFVLKRVEDENIMGQMEAEVDKTGKAVFTRIPSGAYELRCWSSGQGAMKVNIPADSVVKFEPTKVNAMRIDVSDPAGALAQAGFLDGDFLVGAGGEMFESERQIQMKLQMLMFGEDAANARVTVVRGGATVEIVVDFTKMRTSGRQLGGKIRPVTR